MPTIHITKTQPFSEGEYAGRIQKVASLFTRDGEPYFRFDIRCKDGRNLKDSLYFAEKVSWRIEQLCKSADLILPENGSFVLTTDDLEGRVVYFGVKHTPGQQEGRVFTNVNYHAASYSIAQNPTLAGAFPPQAPRHLRPAPPEGSAPENNPDPGATPRSPLNPFPWPETASRMGQVEDDTMSPEEFARVLAKTRADKTAGK